MRNEISGAYTPPGGGLSEEQRMNRICELLSKAVMADWTERLVREAPTNRAATENGGQNAEASDGQRILDYLALVGSATPSTIRATLDLPRMRLYRAVQPMLANGRLTASGRTNTITYHLAPGKGVDPGLN